MNTRFKKIPQISEDLFFRFMKVAIERIDICMATDYAIQKLLIEKNILSEEEMIKRVEDAKTLPERLTGMSILNDMIDNLNKGVKNGT